MAKKKSEMSVLDALRINLRAARDVKEFCPGLYPAIICHSAAKALSPYATIWLSAQLLGELAGLRRPDVLLKWVLLTIGITAFASLVTHLCNRWQEAREALYYRCHDNVFTKKFFSLDYADIDRQQVQDLFIQIGQSANWGGWGFNYIPMYLQWLVEGVAGILGAVALTVSLFTAKVPDSAGTLTVLNHPLFILALLGAMALITGFGSYAGNKANAAWSGLAEESRFGNRLFSHFFFSSFRKESALDIRMYRQKELSQHYMNTVKVFGAHTPMARLKLGFIGINISISQGTAAIFTGLVYIFVCLKAWAGAFGIGSVTQYVGAVTSLSGNVQRIIELLGHMRSNGEFLKTTYEFLDIPNAMYQGSLTTEKRRDRQYEVEFRDVSFKYPGAENWALRHVNMKFKVGKRLAIVGENGSGKTTFIKLLCRLYDPQEGEILLNGIDIRKYNYRDYMDIFSIVFQDFQLISQPLGNNVAGAMEYDRERAERCLRDAGFGDRLAELPDGLDTYLYKDFGREGVNVSGGEAQKIAIARALYKDAPFIILDEPTAALDPIAEAEIYEKFDGIAGDKTAIYISHRLSSCKFCDEIAVFHEGAVIQQGRHADLVADESGKYHELWNAQAQYYTETKAS